MENGPLGEKQLIFQVPIFHIYDYGRKTIFGQIKLGVTNVWPGKNVWMFLDLAGGGIPRSLHLHRGTTPSRGLCVKLNAFNRSFLLESKKLPWLSRKNSELKV